MNLENYLGLGEIAGAGLLGQARDRWEVWEDDFPVLRQAGGPENFRPWLRTKPDQGPETLLALASLGAVDGWDDPVAAAVLAWTLLPGANALSYRLRDLGPDVPTLVAGHLWIAARTFSWRTAKSVATGVLTATRRAVLAETVPNRQVQLCGDHLELVVATDGQDRRGLLAPNIDPTAADELLDVLEWAQYERVLSERDLELLVSLVQVAGTLPDGRRGHRQGLLTRRACDLIAKEFDVGPHTVRRRVSASVEALAAVRVEIGQ